MCTNGSLKSQECFLQDQPTETSLLARSPLNLGRGFGNHGLLASARPLCGWQLETAVGQRIVCRKGAFLIQNNAPYATKPMKQSSTSFAPVYLLDSSGSLSYSRWS